MASPIKLRYDKFLFRLIPFLIVIYVLMLSTYAVAESCEGNFEYQEELGKLALRGNYTYMSFGYLCQYSQSTLNSYPHLPAFHAGVDFPATAGKAVYPAIAGILKKSSTPNSVLLVPDGKIDGKSIKLFYTHIDPITTKYGYVTPEEQIATIQNMSGSHLHVEVRTDYSGDYLLGKSSCSDGNCDTKTEVSSLTVDPGKIVLLGGDNSPNWYFTDDFERWFTGGVNSSEINSNGWIVLNPENDPKLISPYLSIETHPTDPNETVDLIQIFGRNNSQNNIGEIFIKTDINGNYVPENSLTFTFPNANRWHLIQINVHDIPGWDEANFIHGIRIDPIRAVSATEEEVIYIDYIRLRKKKASTNVADKDVRWHPDGAFLKSASSSSVYLIEGGKKRPIPDGAAFEAYNYDWTNIITVRDAELACYPDGAPIPPPMSIDRVIKRVGVDENGKPLYPKVYFVTGNDEVRRHIANETVAGELGINLLSDVQEMSETELALYDEGPEITSIYPEGTLIKAMNLPGYYIISNGEARQFSSLFEFEKLGYSTSDDDEDGLCDSLIETKNLPQSISAHPVDASSIYQCGGEGGCIPVINWPIGGEIFTGGTARETNYTILCPDQVSNVVFSCTTDGYVTQQIINQDAPKNSVQTWHIPDVTTEKASVKITAYDLNGRPFSASPERYITIESNAVPGQDYFDIYNDGGIDLEVSSVTLEKGSAWAILNSNNPLPPVAPPLIIGANSSLRIPAEVNKAGLSSGLYTDTIHIVSNDANHPEATVEIELNVKAENSAPDAPIDLTAIPENWSGANTLSIRWTDPEDPSGIMGGYYKIGSVPNYSTDGVYFDIGEKPLQIPMLSDGIYDVYVWLNDGADNIDHNNHAMVRGLRDTTPPQIIQLSPSENTSHVPIHTSISCSLNDEFSGVDPGSLTMIVNGTTVSPQEISVNGKNVWVQYQPDTNFNFNQTVTVYLKISDGSDPINYIEKEYTFNTFSSDDDADGDGLTNGDEYNHGTDPLNSDSDFDGMPDGWEVENGLNPNSSDGVDGAEGDIDGDGLSNIQEYLVGLYYSAESAIILDAPTGSVQVNSFTIHIGGNGVVAYKYRLNAGSWQAEAPVTTAIELSDLADGPHQLYVIGKDQNGYWQSQNSPTTAVWTVDTNAERYSLSNSYIYLSGTDGYIDHLQVDPTGSGNYGQNIIHANGKVDWEIDGGTFSNPNTTVQDQEADRLILNNQAGALWDIGLNGNQFSSSLNLVYTPGHVELHLDMPYEDSGYFDYAQRYHWELGNNHDASEIPFKTFYSQTGNSRTIEYFMRNDDDGHYMKFRTNSLDDTQHEPTSGSNRLIAIGTGSFDIDFENLPSHEIWMEKTGNMLTLCSGQDTNEQTINFDFKVTQVDEFEGIDVNENGDKMPYFYTSANETITNVYGGTYTFDELLNRFYRQSAFYYTDVGLNIWWNWASQYTGFVNNWYRNKLKANLATWEQGDDGYGHNGYMWSWPGNREWPMGDLYLTYDFRFLNTNALFIQAVWNYYAWTGDGAFLSGQLQRLRDAMAYQLDWLGGNSEYLINGHNTYDTDHGGIHNEDVGTNYWDIMPFGGKDAYCSIDFYKSLNSMAQIEYAVGNMAEGDSYVALADQAETAYNDTFWSVTTNRYVGAIDRLADVHDFGFTFVNIEAVAAGIADSGKVNQIFSWLDSGDIYSKWKFAPRTNTASTKDLWRILNNNTYEWGAQLQDGGANLYVSGYDVIARAKNVGADDAYGRLKAILSRYSEPDKLTGGSPTIFDETIQGGTVKSGSLGLMSHEFPESGVAGSAFLYAFIGLEPKWDGLHIEPKLPAGQNYIGAKNINYHGMNLNFHITANTIRIECTKNENIGDSFYVINGQRKQFPTGTFVRDENYGDDTEGPSLSITSHSNNDTVYTATITLEGTASDGGNGDNGIQQVTINGVRASNDTAAGSGTATWGKDISLDSGDNEIIVIAYDDSPANNPTSSTMNVTYTPPAVAEIALSLTSLSNTCYQHQNAPDQTFEVWNSGEGTLNYSVSTDAPWVSCVPLNGASTGEHDSITVIYTTSGLVPGQHFATITITDPGASNSPQTIAVTLTVASGVPGAPIPDTGQTSNYTGTFGEDSDYLINAPSYTKLDVNGNELPDSAIEWVMVRDNVTGLIWEVKQNKDDVANYDDPHDADNEYTWYDSNPATNGASAGTPGDGTDTEDFIADLNTANFGGHSDWRIPTIKELESILNLEFSIPAIDRDYFPNTMSENHWSSTPYENSTTHAWYISFYYGLDSTRNMTYGHYVRAVRGEVRNTVFIDNSDGTVTDTSTGLMWQQSIAGPMNWEAAISHCEGDSLEGYEDWRLPTSRELRSIVDYSISNPAIDPNPFPDTLPNQYWSSTTRVSNDAYAWNIDWLKGNGPSNEKSNNYYVRAVRGGQNEMPGHLFIQSPSQASKWEIGSSMPIRWDTQEILGNVEILISRQGGKDGTFEPIEETTENDGLYDWTVTGSQTVNCMIKIAPINEPGKGTVQEIFTISLTTRPTATISGVPQNPANTTSATLTIGGEGVTHYKYSLNQGAYSDQIPIATAIELTGLEDGGYTVNVFGIDALGNWQSDATTASWTVDTTAPTVTISGHPPSPTNSDAASLTIGGEGVTHYKSKLDDEAYGNEITVATPINLTELSDGSHTVSVIGRDEAGNWQAEASATTTTWIVDTTTPMVTGLSDDPTPTQNKTWTWGANEAASFRYAIDQIETWTPTGGFDATTNATKADGNGAWYLHVQAKDTAGNESAVTTVSAILDNTAPAATISGTYTSPSNQTGAAVTVNGVGVTHYKYKLDSSAYSSETVVATPINLTGLSDGSHTVSVIGRDEAGNWQAEASATTATWTVDTVVPTVTGVSDDPTPTQSKTWNWDANEAATFRYAVDQNETWTPAGGFDATSSATKPDGDGTWYLHVQAKDTAGNEGTVTTVSAILDNTAPAATISGTPTSPTNQTGATLTVNGEGITHYKYKLDSGAYSSETAVATPISLSGLSDGSHTVSVIGRDEVGNWQAETSAATATWTVDTVVPNVTGLSDDPTPTQSKTWNWDANEMATFRYAVDQNETWTPLGEFGATATATKSDGDGTWYLHVQAKDAAGNEGAVTTFSAILDNTAPAATISGTPTSPTTQTDAALTVNGVGVTHYKYKLDSGAYSGETAVASPINLTGLSDGSHTVSVIGRDEAGNWQAETSATTATWTVDTVVPNVTGLSDDPTPTQSKTWNWDANEAATFRHAVDQSETWTPTGGFDAKATATKPDGDGIWYLHAQAKDGAGNEGDVATVSAVLDNTVPTVSIQRSPDQDTHHGDYTLTVSVSDGTVEYSLDTGPWTSYADPVVVSEEGSHSFEAKSTDEAGNAGEAAPVTFTIEHRADISIEKSADNTKPDLGDHVVFTISVTNNGPNPATGIQVTDQLPDGISYVVDDSGGFYDSVTGIWNVGDLAEGESATLKLTAKIEHRGSITNTAARTASSPQDPNSGNDSDDAILKAGSKAMPWIYYLLFESP